MSQGVCCSAGVRRVLSSTPASLIKPWTMRPLLLPVHLPTKWSPSALSLRPWIPLCPSLASVHLRVWWILITTRSYAHTHTLAEKADLLSNIPPSAFFPQICQHNMSRSYDCWDMMYSFCCPLVHTYRLPEHWNPFVACRNCPSNTTTKDKILQLRIDIRQHNVHQQQSKIKHNKQSTTQPSYCHYLL